MPVPANETYLVAEGESQLMVTRNNDTEYRCAVYSTVHQDSGYASSNVSFYVFGRNLCLIIVLWSINSAYKAT